MPVRMSEHPPDLSEWPITVSSVARSRWGLNNESWFVSTRQREYVARVYASTDGDVIRAEHALLLELGDRSLPFAVPRPVPRRDGTTFGLVPSERGPRFVALFERIRGDHLNDDDWPAVERAARAFAVLDQALLDLAIAPSTFDGDLAAVSPLVADFNALDELGPEGSRFVQMMASEATRVRAAIAPRQLIHGDFGFGNILVDGGEITGVLDFEFATVDARVSELAAALRLVLSKDTREELWRPLLRGYLSRLPLSDEELEVLPVLTLHHEAVLLVWSLGRRRAGDVPTSRVLLNVQRALDLETWMAGRARDVVREAHAIVR